MKIEEKNNYVTIADDDSNTLSFKVDEIKSVINQLQQIESKQSSNYDDVWISGCNNIW